jgi:hypothetical protein
MRRIVERLLWIGVPANSRSAADRDATIPSRVQVLETELHRLEAALEALQDAVYRRSQLDDDRNDELLRRTRHDEL